MEKIPVTVAGKSSKHLFETQDLLREVVKEYLEIEVEHRNDIKVNVLGIYRIFLLSIVSSLLI
jgi:galacturan 1,4-alpha-galacturonidase